MLLKAVSVCSAFRCFQAVQHSVQRLPGGRAATDEVAEVTFGVGYGEEGLLFAIRHDMLLEEYGDLVALGTIGDVVQVLSMPDGAIHVLVKTFN